MKKSITHILNGKEKHISDEDVVIQSLPTHEFRFANPFIVVHHMGPKILAPGTVAGSFPHPHRGFAPVTFIVQGELSHKDNAGHTGACKAGDAQWMFAGKGLLHDEVPPAQFLKQGGTQEFLQLWINVPKANKWDEPDYQQVKEYQQPLVVTGDGISFRLISGTYDGKQGPMRTHTPVVFMRGNMAGGKQVTLRATPGYWTLLYIIKGEVSIQGDQKAVMHNLVVFEKDNDEIMVSAGADTQVLFMSAEPIEEPLAAKGNFVMNTPEEVQQAMEDYEGGKFGTWS